MSAAAIDSDQREREAIARVGARLAATHALSPRLAAAQLPVLLLAEQRAATNITGDVAASNPGRLAFAMASSALGFMGEPLPDLFSGQDRSHAIGAAIRREYDAAVAAAEGTAP